MIDQTGLNGHYDFNVQWSAPEGTTSSAGLGTEGRGLLISMLKDKFGLQLSGAYGPVQYWVVDQIEPPTEN